jgi:threonylcarbamoyladenosine tRNA methylthiotransferase MtaB
MKHFLIQTLGCKVNQCESAALSHGLEATGYRPAHGEAVADVVIINTCTVTGRAAMQSRQAVRQAIRKHPHARVVVTGCLAQTAVDELRTISGVDLVVGHAQKSSIPDLLDRIAPAAHPLVFRDDIGRARTFTPLPWTTPEGRTRAFLKIQDGCNSMCTYCIVPYARGPSRSMGVDEVLDHFERLGNNEYREVVLTGIHLGTYGADLSPPITLADLIDRILNTAAVQRLRLSSIEPTEVDPRILDQMAESELLCHHWHIPLQSGADDILKCMGRPYSRFDYARVIRAIYSRLPYAAIGADVLVGFPGEDDAAFRQTYALIEELPLSYLHVFPFSPRKGTPAAGFKGRPPESVVKTRCAHLRRLGEEKRSRFYRSVIGRTVQVLIQNATDSRTGVAGGLSGNYIPVLIQAPGLLPNMIVNARIENIVQDRQVFARLLKIKDTEE